MIVITRQMAVDARICDITLFENSPRYNAERDALVYQEPITFELLLELAAKPRELRWLVARKLLPVAFYRAEQAITEAAKVQP